MGKMRKMMILISVITFLMASCDTGTAKLVSVGVNASLATTPSRAITSGTLVDSISAYNVTFAKVEIGNSEEDKFTLWESTVGENKDVSAVVDFGDSAQIMTGTYNYVRLTIGQTLNIEGSINDEGTIYNGTGICQLNDTQYLWGTDIENNVGIITLQNPIVITDDCTLSFQFNIDGTVTYQSGTEDSAQFSVDKPNLILSVIND